MVLDPEMVKQREEEIDSTVTTFLRNTIINLLALEGMSGIIDIAFKIDRRVIIKNILLKLVKELEEDDNADNN